MLYGAVIPQYKPKDRKYGKGQKEEVIRADDPRNRERVRKIFENFE